MNYQFKDAFTLLRIPFSVYLMPIYWFALSELSSIDWFRAVAVFFVIHILVYPASNGYNSYWDKDEGSIGGLKNPPPVNEQLFKLVVLFDILALMVAFSLSWVFAALVGLYLLISKAYSYPPIRLKKYPITSTFVVIFFQGAFTYLMVQEGINPGSFFRADLEVLHYALVSTLFLCGSYPLTQVYQHEEDAKRGDHTLSLLLGIKGTFIFAAISLSIASGLLASMYLIHAEIYKLALYGLGTAPILFFFFSWVKKVWQDTQFANFEYTMKMNRTASLALSISFVAMLVFKWWIL